MTGPPGRSVLVVAALGAGLSCLWGQQGATGPATSEPSDPASKACLSWAMRVERSINFGDPSLLNQSLDSEAIWDKATANIVLPDSEMKKFYDALVRPRMGTSLCEQIKRTKGRYKFLRLRQMLHGQQLALFRLTGGELPTYHGYVLSADAEGKVVVSDVYFYVSGNDFSELVRGILLLREKELASAAGDVSGKWIPVFLGLIDNMNRARYRELLDGYIKLPDNVRQAKWTQLARMTALAAVNPEEYAVAFEDFRRLYPDDPVPAALSLQYHLSRKEYDEALKAIDRLEQTVERDPHLDYVRAEVLLAAGKFDQAKTLAEKALTQEPDLVGAQEVLVVLALTRKDYAEVSRLLTALEEKGAPTLSRIMKAPGYSDFIKSPEYKTWMESRKKK